MVSNATQQDKSNLILPLSLLAALLPIIGGAWWYLERGKPATDQQPSITAEGKAYVRNLKLSGVEMKATASFTGATIVEIVGDITNNGDRGLSRVELNCVFYDPNGLVVLRERVPIVKSTFKPGETKNFRLPFETIPPSWNQTMPQLVIASIQFAS